MSYVASNLATGTYSYHVLLREAGTATFEVNPVANGLTSESTLSGKLWCP